MSVQGNEFAAGGTNRREFIKIITMAAASVGLSSSAATRIAEAATRGLKPSVVWLHFQTCTGRKSEDWPRHLVPKGNKSSLVPADRGELLGGGSVL
jgi:hypothetical protein